MSSASARERRDRAGSFVCLQTDCQFPDHRDHRDRTEQSSDDVFACGCRRPEQESVYEVCHRAERLRASRHGRASRTANRRRRRESSAGHEREAQRQWNRRTARLRAGRDAEGASAFDVPGMCAAAAALTSANGARNNPRRPAAPDVNPPSDSPRVLTSPRTSRRSSGCAT